MATLSAKEGKGPCPQCQSPVMFKRSSGGKLNYACDECDTSGYAHQGGEGERAWLASIPKQPAPDADPAPAPAPAKKSAAAGFSLGAL